MSVTTLSALFLISVHFPVADLLTPYKSAYPISRAVHEFVPPNHELYQYRISLYGIDFYNRIRTPLVEACGELEYGFVHLSPAEFSQYYSSNDRFYQRSKGNGGVYCVTRQKKNLEELRKTFSAVEILWENGDFYLVRLQG